MEDQLLPKLFESSATFGLLGFVIFKIVGMLADLVRSNQAMAERMADTNAKLADALKGFETARLDEARAHAEQAILLKMTLDKVAELENGR